MIVADLLMAEEERKANEAHAREQAESNTGKSGPNHILNWPGASHLILIAGS